ASVPLLATNASQMLVTAPGQGDGPQTITVTDPVSGASSVMTNALTFGAASTDKIIVLQGANPPTPVGAQATNPVSVRVVASDGVTPVAGATVGWTTTNGAELSVCGGVSNCSVTSDESGMASTWVTPGATGVASITATLAPGVYNPPQSVAATLFATSSPTAIGVTTPYLWVAQGATVSVPVTARVLSTGAPISGATVCFSIVQGSGSLNPTTIPGCPRSTDAATTNSAGYASVTLTLTNFTANVQLTACVAGGSACATVYGNAVAAAQLNLQAVSGAGQVVNGSPFQPLVVRVTDSSSPPNPVLAASVFFQSTVLRAAGDNPVLAPADPTVTQTGMLVVLGESQSAVLSDVNGLASFVPSAGSFTGPLEVEIQVSAGTTAALQDAMESIPTASRNENTPPTGSPERRRVPVFIGGRHSLRGGEF
ncbi:MAG: Ig-like domain-containing protein, partial [Candidatus Sulfotelmatobacter sp.]